MFSTKKLIAGLEENGFGVNKASGRHRIYPVVGRVVPASWRVHRKEGGTAIASILKYGLFLEPEIWVYNEATAEEYGKIVDIYKSSVSEPKIMGDPFCKPCKYPITQ